MLRRATLDDITVAAVAAVRRGDLTAAMFLYTLAGVLTSRDPEMLDALDAITLASAGRMIAAQQARTS